MKKTKNIENTENTAPSHEETLLDIGNRLYEARKKKRISQEEVSAHLKLSVSQVKGLETGDWGLLPDAIYALGFLRQYAAMLGVDIDANIDQLKTNLSLTQPITIPDPAIAPNKRWAMAALFLFIALFAYFNFQQDNDLQDNDLQEINNAPASSAPEPAAVVPMHTKPMRIAPINKEEPPTSDRALKSQAATKPTAMGSEGNEKAITPNKTGNNGMHRVLLLADGGSVWLSLSVLNPKNGETIKLKETLLRDGENISVDTAGNHLLLTAGNAMALSISIDGIMRYKTGTLGIDGKVLRKFAFNLVQE
ncbi:MAG: helix-turn-helix domain-containing protein [Mariprofundaceae bacterium]|nr:helix-turn-helix domain-containing protein [Mariprofundaceae bacterium]